MYHRKKLQEKLIGNKGYKLYHENIKFMQLIKQPKHQTAFSPSGMVIVCNNVFTTNCRLIWMKEMQTWNQNPKKMEEKKNPKSEY